MSIWSVVSLVGAALDLGAYVAAATGRVGATDVRFLVTNLVGTTLLLAAAVHLRDAGFIILNAAWLLFTLVALRKVWTR